MLTHPLGGNHSPIASEMQRALVFVAAVAKESVKTAAAQRFLGADVHEGILLHTVASCGQSPKLQGGGHGKVHPFSPVGYGQQEYYKPPPFGRNPPEK